VLVISRVLYHGKGLVFAFICGWLALINQNATAALVNWDVLTWAPGSLSNSYDVDPGNPGNDVTFTVGGDVNTLTNDATSGVSTPAITMSLAGGLSPVQKSLELAANLKTNSQITFTVNFSPQYLKGVANVSFSIFDIDLETNKDRIGNIYGIALDGSHVAPTITVGPAVTKLGVGLNQVLVGTSGSPDTGPASANGNALISFGSTPIKGFAFTWSNSNGAPKYQQIAIGDISFDVVPEVNPGAAAALLCIAAAVIQSRRKLKSR
jgi:hypothetical protein